MKKHRPARPPTGSAAPLPTKLFIPVPGPDVVPRGRLLASLSATRGVRLVLVSAPPGAGKTTLVADWLRDERCAACWVSLEAGDNDPQAFLSCLVEAFHAVGQGLCDRAQALVASGAAPEPAVVVRSLVADLADASAAVVLVLDDYHVIADPAIHDLVTVLIERSPPGVRLVLITRSDPPMPLARMRGRGQLHEVREADLRFDVEEAGQMTERLCRRALSRDAVAKLAQRTEGWAVGLQLAGLALRQAADPDAFVAAFTGTHTFVADYLADEVLATLPADHQQFLLRTAPLHRLTGPLCDAALERVNSQALLADLHRANLLLVPLDGERRWFRYHHLFADLLRRRGLDLDPEAQRAVLRRAAAWCEAHDALDDAVAYALQAGDGSRAADLVARHGIGRLAAGQGVTVLRWIRLLPDDIVSGCPDLCVIAAWSLTLMQVYDTSADSEDGAVARAGAGLTPADPIGGYAQRALDLLAMGQRPHPYVDDVGQHARVLLASAEPAAGHGAALHALEAARDETPEANLPLRAVAELRIGELCTVMGRYAHGLEAHARARDQAVRCGADLLRVSAATGRAWILLLEGRLAALIAAVDAELAGRRSLRESLGTYVGNLCAFLAAAHLERHDITSAEAVLARAWTAFGALGSDREGWRAVVRLGQARPRASHLTVHGVLWGFATQVRLLVRHGDYAAALRHLDDVYATATLVPSGVERLVVDALRVRAWTAAGDTGALRHWLRAERVRPSGVAYWDRAALLTEARAASAVGQSVSARSALERLTTSASPGDRDMVEAEALVLAATLHTGAERCRRLDEALERTALEGHLSPWLDAGPDVVPCLEATVRESRVSASGLAHAAAIIGLLRDGAVHGQPKGPDALSERELTVLRLIAAGQTNQQIADTLYLAVGSVKKHTHNIFGKLGVSNRTHAVTVARERQLLHGLPEKQTVQ